jgi:hypothetical protein
MAHIVYLDSDVPRDGDTSAPPNAHARLEALARAHGDGWRVPPAEDTRRQDDRIRGEPGWRYQELAASHAAPFTAPRGG